MFRNRTETERIARTTALTTIGILLLVIAGTFGLPSAVAQTSCQESGPDAGGYRCLPITYSFQDIRSSGTGVSLSDDALSGAIPLPFPYTFYGSTYSNVYIQSNGLISFSANAGTSYTPTPPPDANQPNNMIAGWWSDLYPPSGGSIKYQTLGSAPNRQFIVQWTDLAHYAERHNYATAGKSTFQIVLIEGSTDARVMLQSVYLPSGAKASVSTENAGGTTAVNFFHGSSTFSNTGVRFWFSPTTPSAPQGLSATGGAREISLSWAAPINDGGAVITNYNIYRGGAFLAQIGTNRTFVDATLGNGQTATYTVAAVNVVGTGPQSASASATTATVPYAPTNQQASRDAQDRVVLTWAPPSNAATSQIQQYVIRTLDPAGATAVSDRFVSASTLTFTESASYSDRQYRISALGSAGEGPAAPLNLPAAPHGPSAYTTYAGDVSLTWSTTYTWPSIGAHDIMRDSARFASIGSNQSFLDANVGPSPPYVYHVRSANVLGPSPWSVPMYPAPITTLSFSAPPTNGWYSAAGATVTLTCTVAPGDTCQSTLYSLNGEPTQTYVGPFQLPDGTNSVYYYSVAASTENGKYLSDIRVDTTPPSIAFSSRTAPNANGWNNGDVTVAWSCADALSGPAAPSVSRTVTAEGAALSATGTCLDNAGNAASATQTGIKIDKTAPGIAFVSRTAPNAAGWNNADVTVTWSCADALSGVTASSVSRVVSTEGSALSSTGTCADVAGNTASNTQTGIKLDKTAPGIALASRTAPNAAGWNNGDVTVTWTCSDALSGASATSVSRVVTTEGASLSSTGTCADVAGNSASNTQTGIKIDKTAPGIALASRTPQPNANGWNNVDVTLTWSCTDGLSGVVATADSAVVTGEGSALSGSGTCDDVAGNSASHTVTGIKIDRTHPTATSSRSPSPGPYGWNGVDVTLTLTCDDTGGSGVTSPSPVVVTTEGAGQSRSLTCTDAAGNSVGTLFDNINIDKSPPAIAFASHLPAPNAAGWNKADVTVTWSCSDALSGTLASSVSAIVSSEGSSNSATGTCVDRALNEAPATRTGIKIDKTAPGIAFASRTAPNAAGWNNADVTVTWSCADALSGVAATGVSQVVSTEGSALSSTGTCADVAGNTASNTQTGIKLDKTAPGIALTSRSPAPNAAGWNKEDVTITWSCTDSLSGATSSSTTQLVSSEGSNVGATGTCTDVAGNSATNPQTGVKLDKTAPAISFASRTAPNAAGWNNEDVTVTWSCADALSGATAASVSRLVSTEGSALSSTGTCADVAGNAASNTQTGIKIDKTAPGIALASRSPTPNANGWNRGDVTVTWSCSDALSGATAGAVSQILRDEGGNQQATGTCADVADNTASDTQAGINIDKSVPVVLATRTPTSLASCAAPGGTLIDDAFDTENGGIGQIRYASFANWQVTRGSVDLYPFGTRGLAIDMDGSSNAGGRLESNAVTLQPGCYLLQFELSMNGVGPNTMTVSLGSLYSETFTRSGTTPFATVARHVQVAAPTTASLVFDQEGGDNAGLVIDQVLLTPTPGWSNEDVTVTFTCVDAVSGVATGPGLPAVLATDGADQSVTRGCIDNASWHGGYTLASIHVDKTAPVLTSSRTPPTANGWNNGDVTVSWTCTDATSGVLVAPVAVTITTEGAAQSATGTCGDVAGNSASDTVSQINVDKTAPGIALASRTPANANGWNNEDVTLSWTCTDALSGVVEGSRTTVVTAESAALSATETCRDLATNAASDTQTGIKIDKTAPGIAFASRLPAANADGWNNETITVTWDCADGLSGATSATSVRSAASEGDAQSLTGTCTDLADNAASATQSAIRIDLTPPTYAPYADLTFPANANGGATITFALPNVTDALSGVRTNACAPASGSFFPLGDTTVACNAVDRADNGATTSFVVTVTHAPLHRIEVVGPGTLVANTTGTYAISGFDQYDNAVPLAQPSFVYQAPKFVGVYNATYGEQGVTGQQAVQVVHDALARISVRGVSRLVVDQTATFSLAGFDQFNNAVPLAQDSILYRAPTKSGNATVTYTELGVTGSRTITILPDALARIEILGPATVVAGTSVQLPLAGFDRFDNPVTLSRTSLTYTAPQQTTVGTVTYTESGVTGSRTIEVVHDALASIVLTGPTSVVAGTTREYALAGFDQYGNDVPLARQTQNHSAPTATGSTVFSYAESGITGSITVQVVHDALASIVLTGPTTIVAGTTNEYALAGFDQYGNSVPLAQATLAYQAPAQAGPATASYAEQGVTGTLGVTVVADDLARIDVRGPSPVTAGTTSRYDAFGFDQHGNVVPLPVDGTGFQDTAPQRAGEHDVTYAWDGVVGSLAVQVVADALARIEISGPLEIPAGSPQMYALAGFDQYGNRVPLQAGSISYLAPETAGPATVTYSEQGITGTLGVTVVHAALHRIEVAGDATPVAGTTSTYALAGFDQYGNAVPLAQATLDYAVPTAAGPATVTYSEHDVVGALDVTVVHAALARIDVSGPAEPVAGTTVDYALAGFDQYGNAVPLAQQVLAYAVPTAVGPATVSYAEQGVTGSLDVTVVPAPLARIDIAGDLAPVAGTSVDYALSGFDQHGNSAPLANATVTFLVPTAAGPATVVYAEQGVEGTLDVTVVHDALARIAVSGLLEPIAGTSETYALAGFDQYGNAVPLAQPNVVFAVPTATGPATVSYAEQGVEGTLDVTVVHDALARITLDGPTTIVAGTTETYALAGFDQYDNDVPLAQTTLAWTAPTAAGAAQATYAEAGVTGALDVTVLHDALTRIGVTGPATVIANTTATFALAGFDQYGNDVPLERSTLDVRAPKSLGTFEVCYEEEGIVGCAAPESVLGPAVRIDVGAPLAKINANRTMQASARAYDAGENLLPISTFAWSATNGTINGTGGFRAGAEAGDATITASLPDVDGSLTVEITRDLPVRVNMTRGVYGATDGAHSDIRGRVVVQYLDGGVGAGLPVELAIERVDALAPTDGSERTTLSLTTGPNGIIHFVVPSGWDTPGQYRVTAEVADGLNDGAAETAYTVSPLPLGLPAPSASGIKLGGVIQ